MVLSTNLRRRKIMANFIRIKNAGRGYAVNNSDTYFPFTKTGDMVDINLALCSNIIHSNDHVYIFQDFQLVASCSEAEFKEAWRWRTWRDDPIETPPKIVEAAAMQQ